MQRFLINFAEHQQISNRATENIESHFFSFITEITKNKLERNPCHFDSLAKENESEKNKFD